jgi:ABC-type polysaccharide/polyol phosphate export permease
LAALRRRLAAQVQLLIALSEADMRVRYGRGPWKLVKWLADPFALLGIYFILVLFVLDRRGVAPALTLACAVIPFQLVMAAIVNAMDSATTRASIITNMAFPRMLLPASAAVTESVPFLASLPLLAALMAIYDITPTWATLWVPILVGVTLALAAALSYPAALVTLWVRDMRPLLISLVRASFFASAGLVPLSEITGRAHDLLKLNPLTGLFEAYRSVLVEGQSPALWELGVPLLMAVLVAAVFVPVYRREEPHLAKVLL